MGLEGNVNNPTAQLIEGIMTKVNAHGTQPRVVVELDKLSYVRGFREKYDAVQFVYDKTVGEYLSIDSATKLTNNVDGAFGAYEEKITEENFPTELGNMMMQMPILKSATMSGKTNDSLHINGMRITDWFETDPRCSRKVHKGIDLDLAKGDFLYAVWAGKVRHAGAMSGYGQVVIIDHGNGWSTRYGHMKPGGMKVQKGDLVYAGKPIGIGWNSGHIITSGGGDGSHLHFEVRHNEVALNPEPFLREEKTIQVPRKTPKPVTPSDVMMDTVDSSPPLMMDATNYVEYNMEATAYAADCKGCTGTTKGGTYVKGKTPTPKIIAVDPAIIPLKSICELIVDGTSWGDYLADDTGGDIKGNRIDILWKSEAAARKEFGRKQVILRVKKWGDGKARTSEAQIDHQLITYKVNKTTEKVAFVRDFTQKKTALGGKFGDLVGAEQFSMPTDKNKSSNILGFRGTSTPGEVKKFTFTHEWFKPGNIGWAYVAELMADDVVQVKVDGFTIVTIKGYDAKHGEAHPPSIAVPKGKHTVEFSLANSARASQGKFGVTYFKVREFDVESEERKAVWDFTDEMNSTKNWQEYGNATIKDAGDYQVISSDNGAEAGIELKDEFKNIPVTVRIKVKVDANTTGSKVYVAAKGKVFVLNIDPTKISTNGGSLLMDNTQWQEYAITVHDETDMDVYVKQGGVWKNAGVRGVGSAYATNRLLFAVRQGKMYIDNVNYAMRDYTMEQLASIINDTYKEKWYEVGSFRYTDTLTIDTDVMQWEVNTHMEVASATASITLNNKDGIYSPDYERMGTFPDAVKASPFSYREEGELRHVISEYTPIRIYAGYGNDLVRVFTGLIKGEIEEDAEAKTVTFHAVDRYDVIEEFVFYKDKSYPPEEAFAADMGAFAWLKSAIVQDIITEAGMTGWRIVSDDVIHDDYYIEETTYIDVNKGKNTFMKFDQKTGDLIAVTEEGVKAQGGWQNPFTTSVTFKVGTRASDAINSLIQDMPYRAYCDRYGTFIFKKMDFLDEPDWSIEESSRWEFIDGVNLISLTSSTDYSRVRNHIMIGGSAGLVEHFFDKDLVMATKGNIRTAGYSFPWIEEKDGATLRGQKQEIANKMFFDMKRQARTKNVVVKGNPLIELLDSGYVYDSSTFTAGHYLIKGNRLVGNESGMINFLELTWKTRVD